MTSEPPDMQVPPAGPAPADRPDPARGRIGTRQPDRPPARRTGRWLVEWTAIVVVALAFAFVVRTYVVQTFFIPSGSMLPTLQIKDRILVDKLSYKLHGVHRGDIVVFKRPPLEQASYSDLVKRVIGLPGETISAVNGQVYIDGKPLAEPWLPAVPASWTGPLQGDPHPQFDLRQPYTVPAGEYFVMGDNRMYSEDSRWFGPIPKSLIVGKMLTVIWPPSHATLIAVGVLAGVVVAVLLAFLVGSVRSARRSSAEHRRGPPAGPAGA